MHPTFENFKTHLQKKYSKSPLPIDKVSPNLISPFVLKLPKSILEQAQNITADLHRLGQSPFYRSQVQNELPFDINQVQPTKSILSSLDVHINPQGQLKIIEVNTNASSYMVNAENYEQRGINTFPDPLLKLTAAFSETFGEALKPGKLFLIVDDKPMEQNLYVEFLLFKQWITDTFGVDCEIADHKDLAFEDGGLTWNGRAVSGIYNRHTDFYFSENKSLHAAYQQNKTLISPNPLGYGLWADKKRMLAWDAEFFSDLHKTEGLHLTHLQNALLITKKFSDFGSADMLWAERSHYFFKPPNSFGGKAVYKGKSISRTVFERIYSDEYLAQELAPAPEETFDFEGAKHTFKYDLRFYIFEGQVQLGAARIYQGQLTNLKTYLGGLTPIEFAP